MLLYLWCTDTQTPNLFKCRNNIIFLYIIIKQNLINALNTRLPKCLYQIVRLKTFWLAASFCLRLSHFFLPRNRSEDWRCWLGLFFLLLRRYYSACWRGCAQLRAQPLVLHHKTDIDQSWATWKPHDVAPVRSCGPKDWSLVRGRKKKG